MLAVVEEGIVTALRLCRLHRATLVIAKLDRVARNVHFISSLMKSGVEFAKYQHRVPSGLQRA
jgi:hypothetical protein